MNKKTAYVYTRVSTGMQVDGYSLAAQEERIRQYAKAYDIEIIKIYEDAGKSGKSILGREQFLEMLNDVESEKDNVDYILVFKLSRFGRNSADTLKSLEIMENHDVHLICVEDGLDSSKDAGKLVITILSAVAEMERETILAQTMAGRKQKAREGKWNGGFAPMGYSISNGILQVNEEEAKSIRMIFDLYANTDMGSNKLAQHLVNLGITKPIRQNGKSPYYSANVIRNILKNPVYNGKIAFGRRQTKVDSRTKKNKIVQSDSYILVDGQHKSLVDDALWNKTQIKLKAQSKKYKKVNRPKGERIYLLSGILKCPECGSSLYGNISKKKNKNKDGEYYKHYFYYSCKHRKMMDGHKCTFSKQLKMETLNHEVLTIISKIVSEPSFAEKLQEKINIQIDTTEIDKTLDKYYNQHRKYVSTKISLMSQIDNLDFDSRHYKQKFFDLNERLNSIYDRIEEINKLIVENEERKEVILREKMTADNVYKILLTFETLLGVMEEVDKKRFCQLLLEKVIVRDEKSKNGRWVKSLYFKLPIIENALEVSLDNNERVECVVLLQRSKG
ncbi:recombinase family protein [Streptococcus equi]|uniref:recombinase family protein n=1 Tax=Streptococcus equi TaxID=1336 RepID=UPI0013F5DA8B|nr:recombinase family protein [Streptococcus equi]MDI5990283.1 recombinase family protein [Streptococcus equi subsp. zooepidemicus]HEL0697977.1 recombinase family protein [Streptococcus equi subsp. zooepidemicus]HEL0807451.1 recombinase family protein [Streptococcus equi subsp. zooepidemicus]